METNDAGAGLTIPTLRFARFDPRDTENVVAALTLDEKDVDLWPIALATTPDDVERWRGSCRPTSASAAHVFIGHQIGARTLSRTA